MSRKKKVLVACFYPVIIKQGRVHYKSTHAYFLNQLSGFFDVFLLTSYQLSNISDKDLNEAGTKLNPTIKLFLSPPLEGGFYKHPFAVAKKVLLAFKALKSCDVVHVFGPSFSPILIGPISLILKKKMTVYLAAEWEETFDNFYRGKNLITKKLFQLSKWITIRVSFLVLVTNKNIAKKYSKLNKNTILTRPLIVNEAFKHVENLKIKERPFKFVFLGKLHPNKNVELVLKAIAQIKKKSQVSLEIIGDSNETAYKKKLKEMANNLGVSNLVNWNGWVGDPYKLKKILVNNFALILASKSEGFPKVIYESQACGLPVIVSSLPNYQGMLRHKGNAMIFEQNDVNGLIASMESLMKDKILYQKILTEGFKFVRNRISMSAAEQYFQLLK